MTTEINDIRSPAELRGVSFSKYKKTEVRTALIQNMKNGKIEPACHWSAELICAGHYGDLWEIILHYMGKHIHLGNPKLAIYLEMRYEVFRDIVMQGYYANELALRNHSKIRKLFAEIICTLSLSNKKHSFEPIKINRLEEFDITQMTDRLKAPSTRYVEAVFKKEDPKELYVAVNEFAYAISPDSSNIMMACYWIEWLIEFDLICKTRKAPCRCEKRSHLAIETKCMRDVIWIIWDALLLVCAERNNPFITKIMNSLLHLFCIKYTTAACKKRRFMLYYAVGLLTDPVQSNIEIITVENKPILQSVIENIDSVYKQIKKNEEKPKTDYLFKDISKAAAMEKTMRQMELLGAVDTARRGPNENNMSP